MKSEECTKAAVVIPVFNRRETTMQCLRGLRETGVLAWVRAFVVDDGSTDGTFEAISSEFPEVEVIHGGGDLWWSGGINRGTETALAWGAGHIFWLNDDCYPRKGTMEKLIQVSRRRDAITCPLVRLVETGEFSFGGRLKTRSWISLVVPEGESLEACDTFSANLVCIPRQVFDRIGLVDQSRIPHSGDIDFGLRASGAGCAILAVGGAFCDGRDPPLKNRQSWLFGDISIREMWKNCFHPKWGVLAPWSWRFRWRHWGFCGVLANASSLFKLVRATLVRIVVPQGLLRRWFGTFSATHRSNLTTGRWLSERRGLTGTTTDAGHIK